MEECLFCNIANGTINSEIIYQTDNVVAFKDINPKAKVHILVIPKKHIESVLDIEQIDADLLHEIFEVIDEVAKITKIDQTGFRVVSNIGQDGRQEVKHLHFHVMGGQKL